jgi:hypothetical protein
MKDTFKTTWMRSILRLEVMSDPFEWPEEHVILAFAARGQASYENWCLKLGLGEKMEKEQQEDDNSVALGQLRAIDPNVVIEENKEIKIGNIVISPAERPE